MGPLRLLVATRTAPPAPLLLQQAKGRFTLWSVAILSFDFPGSACPSVRSPVAAPVFDDQDWMGQRPVLLLAPVPTAARTSSAGTGPHPCGSSGAASPTATPSHPAHSGSRPPPTRSPIGHTRAATPRRRAWRSKPIARSTVEGPPLRPSPIPSGPFHFPFVPTNRTTGLPPTGWPTLLAHPPLTASAHTA